MKNSPRVKVFSLQVRLAKLRLKHQSLKAKIAKELKRPSPCSMMLQGLKRQRLRTKDEILRCLTQLRRTGLPGFSQQQSA
ncbi:YdcH family protein [Leisingera aquaemixtae]|uniref:YdcH family protein n=1 Tax=Leisingera aquaemixtae TaxID=1396826 RepID=A0ABY5WMN7_9RHOB|nr:YdcH family protein [Leisingera aquaemixtae]UWQ42695.1 YdcH family protein [Leisingera aquaemixtae]